MANKVLQVNVIMTNEDKFGVALLCMADCIQQALEQRTELKTRRWNRLQNFKKAIMDVDETFRGGIDDEFRDKAEQFYKEMEASLTKLLQRQYREEHDMEGQEDQAAGQIQTDLEVNELAMVLHEAGREAVEKNLIVRTDVPTKGFMEWPDITEAAREGRRVQARYLLARYNIRAK